MGWEKIEFAGALNQSNIWRLCLQVLLIQVYLLLLLLAYFSVAVFSTAETSAKERLESYLNLIIRSILICPCRHKILLSSHGLRAFRECLLRPISICFRTSHFACKPIVPSPHPNVGTSQNASIRTWNNEVAFEIQNPI